MGSCSDRLSTMYSALSICVVTLSTLAASACINTGDSPYTQREELTAVPSGPLSFSEHVLPIFQRHGCTGCHGAGGGTAQLDTTSAAGLAAGGRSGAAVSPCAASDSLLQTRLADCSMPPAQGACLTRVELDTVARWIDQGAAATFDAGICPDPPVD